MKLGETITILRSRLAVAGQKIKSGSNRDVDNKQIQANNKETGNK